jgi:hypothetical protein
LLAASAPPVKRAPSASTAAMRFMQLPSRR